MRWLACYTASLSRVMDLAVATDGWRRDSKRGDGVMLTIEHGASFAERRGHWQPGQRDTRGRGRKQGPEM
jgi:hypothetical protein